MNKNFYMLFAGLFFALCFALMFGVWYSIRILGEYRKDYEALEAERRNYTGMISSLEERNKTLRQIVSLSINENSTVQDSVAFYSEVRQAIENNGMNLLSMSSPSGDDARLSLSIQGSYYSFAHLLADWRGMPYASRITQLRIVRDPQAPYDFVNATLTIEGMNQ